MTTPGDLLNTLPNVKGERRQRVTSNNDMLEELERSCANFQFLGSYAEV